MKKDMPAVLQSRMEHKVKKIERIVLNALRRQLEIFKQLAKKLEELSLIHI